MLQPNNHHAPIPPPSGATPAQAEVSTPTTMQVKKRSGAYEPVDVGKIVRAVGRRCQGLNHVDANRVAIKTISGLYDGASTQELDQLSIQTAASFIAEEPEYSKLAARLLATYIDKEVRGQDVHSFSQSVSAGVEAGLINERLSEMVRTHARKLNDAIVDSRNNLFEYFGLRTVYDRYLLRHPTERWVIETPQYFFMRVACACSQSVQDAIELYRMFSSLEYIPSSPTLFNAGTRHEQLSSCFLLDSPQDDLTSIYETYGNVAQLSKFSGGIGLAFHRVRARGSLIKSTNGHSNGIVPWLKTLDASVAAVNQGGKRKGAACVYLETWHADVEEFLELRDNTGDEARRTHNLNLSNWVPDLFMQRVEASQQWSLFDPKVTPELTDLYGEAFERAYVAAEAAGKATRTVAARDLYAAMMRTLAQTGNGWMTFKDASNKKCNQIGPNSDRVVHLSNLCTEIIEVTDREESAVCNLGSINLSQHMKAQDFDFDHLHATVKVAVRQLDRVIDLNFYPIKSTARSNAKWRPVGLGLMGLQDVFFIKGWAFDSPLARRLSQKIQEEIYFAALTESCEMAKQHGAHPGFAETKAAQGILQFDLWDVVPEDTVRWDALKAEIKQHGLRNSLLLAIAPTATIASISGCYECIEPQVSNLFKRETLSGEFLQINRYLVRGLKTRGLWTEEVRNAIKVAEGSIQGIAAIPADLKEIYRTAWEVPMRSLVDMAADRGAYLDQSQSLNLFMESPKIGPMSAMYFYAWKKGLKTTYYLRSRPATRIAKTTADIEASASVTDEKAVACSLENPEYCESCQ